MTLKWSAISHSFSDQCLLFQTTQCEMLVALNNILMLVPRLRFLVHWIQLKKLKKTRVELFLLLNQVMSYWWSTLLNNFYGKISFTNICYQNRLLTNSKWVKTWDKNCVMFYIRKNWNTHENHLEVTADCYKLFIN